MHHPAAQRRSSAGPEQIKKIPPSRAITYVGNHLVRIRAGPTHAGDCPNGRPSRNTTNLCGVLPMLPYDAERIFADAVSSVQWVRTDEVLTRCLETAKMYFVRFANKHNWCEDEARERA